MVLAPSVDAGCHILTGRGKFAELIPSIDNHMRPGRVTEALVALRTRRFL